MNTLADLYIRVSTEEQKLTGFSQRYQEEILKAYCSIHTITVEHIVFEDYSAKTFNRPAWKELFTAYRTHQRLVPRLLLVTKWDRFSRNTSDAYEMLKKLSQLGVEVRAIEQPVDMSIPENKMMLAFFLAVPEVENARRSMEIKKGRNRGITEGRWMGLAPYAYKNMVDANGAKYIEPVEMQARIMRFAFQKLSTGLHTVTEVFHLAVEYGFNKSINCFWKAIRNPVYCGKVTAHRDGKVIGIQGQHQAIVSESLFLKVQQVLDRRKVVPRNLRNNDMFPLRGLLLCPVCHRTMTGSGSTGKCRKVYYYYHCHPRCHVRFPVRHVHEQLEHFLNQLSSNSYFEQCYQQIEKNLLGQEAEQQLRAQGRILKKIEVVKQRLTRLDRLLLDGSVEPAHYKSLKLDCEAQIELLQSALTLATSRLENIQQLRKHHHPVISYLGKLYMTLNAGKKREMISWLFPFGIIYTPSCFMRDELLESLRIIFEQHTTELQPVLGNMEEHPANSFNDDIEDNTFLRKLVQTIITDYTQITLKQASEIAKFFYNVARLAVPLEDAP